MTRSLFLLTLLASSFIYLSVPAYADPGFNNTLERSDWYMALSGGWVQGQDPDDVTDNGLRATADADDGWAGSVAIGKYYDNIRLEGEVSYHEYDADVTITSGATRETGGTTVTALSTMGNVYYDFNFDQKDQFLTPYIGLGLGLAYVETDDTNTTSFRGEGVDEIEAAYQAMIGVNGKMTYASSVGLGYRYFDTFDGDNYGGSHEFLANMRFDIF